MAGIIEIPRVASPSPQLQPLPTVVQPTPRTSDADFGGDIGRALSDAGEMLGDAVLGDAARRNEAAARSIDTSFAGELRTLLHEPERGYYATKGRAAVDAYGPTYQAITALYDRHIAQAANPAQQQMARAVLDRRLRLAADGIAAHSVRQDASWQDETRGARIDGAIADATLAWRDPAQLRLHYNTGLQEALARAGAETDPVAADAARRGYVTKFHAAVIGARIDADPEGARQYFEQNRAAMDAAAAAAFDARLALASERRRALDIAERAAPRDAGIVAFGPGPEPQRDDYVNRARAEAEALPDATPSLIGMAEAAAAKRHARDHAAWTQRRGEAITAAYAWADANPDASVAEMPMQLWAGLDPDTQTRVEGYVNAGGKVETDWHRYYELQDLAIERPDDFVNVDLGEEKPDIADRDLDLLEILQEALRKGDPDNERLRLRAAKEMVDEVVNASGVQPENPAVFDLRRRFEGELAALRGEQDRLPERTLMARALDRATRSPLSMETPAQSDPSSAFAMVPGRSAQANGIPLGRFAAPEPAINSSDLDARTDFQVLPDLARFGRLIDGADGERLATPTDLVLDDPEAFFAEGSVELVVSRSGAALARMAAVGLARITQEVALHGWERIAEEVYFETDSGVPIRIDGVFWNPHTKEILFGEAKIGQRGLSTNQNVGLPELEKGKGSLYGEQAREVAKRLGLQPDAKGRFRIPPNRIYGVYVGTYERSVPQTPVMRDLNREIERRGGLRIRIPGGGRDP